MNSGSWSKVAKVFSRHQLMVLFLGLACIFGLLFSSTLATLKERWDNPEEPYTASLFVLVLVAYLVWQQLRVSSISKISPSWLALVFTLLSLCMWYAGFITQTMLVTQLMLPIIFFGWLWSNLGWSISRKLILPLLFCYFTIPVWGGLGVPLRSIAIVVVEWCLGWLQVPAFIEGFKIYLPMGVVEIADGCSGQNYLIASLVMGCFYALSYLRLYTGLACIFLITLLALIANWVRIFILVLVGYYSEMQSPLLADHVSFGWIVFAVFVLIFFFLVRYLDSPKASVDEASTYECNEGVITVWEKVTENKKAVSIALLTLLTSPVFPLYFPTQSNELELSHRMIVSREPPHFVEQPPNWLPAYVGYDSAQQWRGDIAGLDTLITVLIYDRQTQAKELVYSENTIAIDPEVAQHSVIRLENGFVVNYSLVNIGGNSKIVYWLYRIGDWHTHSGLIAKALQIPASIAVGPQVALITLSRDCSNPCSGEESHLAYVAQLEQILPLMSWTY